jgi:hypothetical protein
MSVFPKAPGALSPGTRRLLAALIFFLAGFPGARAQEAPEPGAAEEGAGDLLAADLSEAGLPEAAEEEAGDLPEADPPEGGLTEARVIELDIKTSTPHELAEW